MSAFAVRLEQKAEVSDVTVVRVPAQHTSLRCNICAPGTIRSCLTRAGLRVVDIDFDGAVYPASGRGVLRRALWRATGGDEHGFGEFLYHRTRAERIKSRPAFGILWHVTAAIERVMLAEKPQQWLGVYGTMVVTASKPKTDG